MPCIAPRIEKTGGLWGKVVKYHYLPLKPS